MTCASRCWREMGLRCRNESLPHLSLSPCDRVCVEFDGTVPKSVLKELTVLIDGRDVSPPESAVRRPIYWTGLFSFANRPGFPWVYIRLRIRGDGGGSHAKSYVFSTTSWIRTEYRDCITGEYHILNKRMECKGCPRRD